MAIFHFEANTGTRSGGHSARAKFDYIAREGSKHEHRDPRLHIESGHMPAFAAADAVAYWSAADEHERANGRLFKHLEIALHRELTFEQNTTLARDFVEKITSNIGGGNLPYTFTIHAGGARDASQTEISKSNIHCDVMISERVNDGIYRGPSIWFSRVATGKNKTTADGGAKKTDALKPEEWLKGARKLWAEMSNQAFAEAGLDVRIDHRTLLEQRAEALAKGDLARAAELDREPGQHLGPKAHGFEKRTGQKSERRKHIERRQQAQRSIANEIAGLDRASSRYEAQISADQDALRREKGLRIKAAMTRRIAAERAAGKQLPSPAHVSPVPAPAAGRAAKAKPASPKQQPNFSRSLRRRLTGEKLAKWAEDGIKAIEGWAKFFNALMERFEERAHDANAVQQQRRAKKVAPPPRPLPEPGVDSKVAPTPAPAGKPAEASQAQDLKSRSQQVLAALRSRKSEHRTTTTPAPAPATAVASQPQAKPAAPTASPAAPVVPDRPAEADPVAAADAARRQGAERRIRLALQSGKGKSAALVDAVRIDDVGSLERLIEAGADPTTNRGAALEAAAQAKRDDLFGKLLRCVPLQDHSDLQQLAQRVGPEASAKLRELAKVAKAGGSLQAAGIEQPKGPQQTSKPSAGPSMGMGGGGR